MAEAVVAVSRAKLAEVLSNWPGRDDDSWAVVFLSVVPTAGELAAVREAAGICDRVVAVRMAPDRVVQADLARVVREAGADVLYVPGEVTGRVEVSLAGEAVEPAVVTLMVQTLTTVLPTVVVAARDNGRALRILRGISNGLGEFFGLRISE